MLRRYYRFRSQKVISVEKKKKTSSDERWLFSIIAEICAHSPSFKFFTCNYTSGAISLAIPWHMSMSCVCLTPVNGRMPVAMSLITSYYIRQ